MDLLRRRLPELLGVLFAGAWSLVLAVNSYGLLWDSYRRDAAYARAQIAGGEDPAVFEFVRQPDLVDSLPAWIQNSVLLAAVAMMGVALVRAGRPVLGLLLPVVLTTAPLLDRTSLVYSTLLFDVDAAAPPRFWPVQEALPQLAVVLVPILLTPRPQDPRRLGMRPPIPLLVMFLALPAGLRLTDPQSAVLTDRAELVQSITVAVVVLGTGLLVAAYHRRGAAAVAVVALVLMLAQASDALVSTYSGSPFSSLDVFHDAGLLLVGPAVVLVAPALGRLWVLALRRGPGLTTVTDRLPVSAG